MAEFADTIPLRSNGEVERGDDPKAIWRPSLHEWLILLSLATISVMISLDATILVTTLNTIATDLKLTTTQSFWVSTSYLLTSAVMMPFIASLSDIFGRSICLLSSLALFTAGSVACCLARAAHTMLIGRCIQGVGGGGIVILSLVVVTDIVPLRFRPQYFGVIQAAWALGTCIGPVLGGVFVERSTWRWIFYLMFPFCFLGFCTIPWLLTLRPRTDTFLGKLKRVDWIGGILFTSSSAAFLVAISWGGSQYAWDSYQTLLPLCLGVFGILLTVAWERIRATDAFLRRSLFHCTSSFCAYAGAATQGYLLSGQFYYISMYFLAVRGYTPVQTGISLFPIVFTLIPSSIVVGRLVTHTNRFRPYLWSGWTVLTVSSGLILIWDLNTSTAVWVTIQILVSIGHGLLLNTINFATQAICLPNDEGAAAGMYSFMRGFGTAVGIGIGSSVFQNVMSMKLRELGLPDHIAKEAELYILKMHEMPDDSPLKETIRRAFVHGLRGLHGSFCAMACLAGILSLFIKHFDMNKALVSEHKLESIALPSSLTLPLRPSTARSNATTVGGRSVKTIALGQSVDLRKY